MNAERWGNRKAPESRSESAAAEAKLVLPYFDDLLEKLRQGDETARIALGKDVHWGYWDDPRTKSVSAEDYRQAAERMTERVIKKAAIENGSTVLDAGCGFGGTIQYLNEKYANCKLVGVNIDPRQLEIARKGMAEKNGNTIHLLEADACKLPLTGSQFDGALCVESIFHFGDRSKFFQECQRVLKPGAILVVSDFVPVHSLNSVMNFAEQTFHLAGQAYGTIRTDISVPKYKKMAQAAGFSVVDIENITAHTLPTYRSLKENLHAHLQDAGKYVRATTVLEYASRIGLLKYLILTFKKNG